MDHYTIQAQFEAECPPAAVVEWLQSPEGIAGWWSDRVSGAASKVGDEFGVDFPTTDLTFHLVVAANGDGAVQWDVPESPPWWKGTSIRFQVDESEAGSTILFTHGGFEPDDPIIAVITPAWVGFLNRLVQVAESGVADPAVIN